MDRSERGDDPNTEKTQRQDGWVHVLPGLLLAPVVLITTSPLLAQGAASLGTTITIGGQERRVIERDMTIHAPVVIHGDGELLIRGAEVTVLPKEDRDDAVIEIRDSGRLILEQATLSPPRDTPENLTIRVRDRGEVVIDGSTFLHTIDAAGSARLTLRHATIDGRPFAITGAFGLVRVAEQAQARVERSTINALELAFQQEDSGTIRGLRAGRVVRWDSNDIGDVDLDVTLTETEVLPAHPDETFGGWNLSIPLTADLRVEDAVLGTCTFRGGGGTHHIAGLARGRPFTTTLERVRLRDVTAQQSWGFALESATVTIADSTGIALFPSGRGTVFLQRSLLNRFEPQQFRGSLLFEDAMWAGRARILDGNAFSLSGSVDVDPTLPERTVVSNATVTRQYPTANGPETAQFTAETFRALVPTEESGAPRSLFASTVSLPRASTRAPGRSRDALVGIGVILIFVGAGVAFTLFLARKKKQAYTRR